MRYIIFLTVAVSICLFSCQKEDEITNNSAAKLSFSLDTVTFDTVFTSRGSATKRLKIYNKNDKAVSISSIKVAGGDNSSFKINVDGISGNNVNDIRIEANDSAYVFVQVNVNPTGFNSPLLIEDSLEVQCNNNKFSVKFRAFGQDVHLIKTDTLKTNTIWQNDKPYLILGDLYVDSLSTLTIEQGTTIYLHRQSWIIVDGTIVVNGSKEQPVVFRGDRLDKANYSPPILYDKIPGQWGEIWLRNTSKNNKFNYAEVRNAEFGLIVGMLNISGKPKSPGQAEVELTNCKFENFSVCALYGNGGIVKAANCIFANSGYFNFSTSTGGDYEFYQCTFANYLALGAENNVGVVLRNYIEVPDTVDKNKKITIAGDLNKAYFGNCIIYGEVEDQLFFKFNKENKSEYMFDHCLIRGNNVKLDISDSKHYNLSKISKDPIAIFAKTDKENYQYDWNLVRKSLARDIGSTDIANEYQYDLNNNWRLTDGLPDAGALEFVDKGEK